MKQFDGDIVYSSGLPAEEPAFDEPWAADAACIDTDQSLFYPDKDPISGHVNLSDILVAKSICSRCVVREQCLDYALGQDIRDGIWGGHSPAERRRLPRWPAAAAISLAGGD